MQMQHYQSSKNRKQKCFFPPYSSFTFRSKGLFKTANEAIGQKLPTLFTDLKLFHSAFFFPVDLMHLFGSNIGPQIANIITTDTSTVNKQSQHPLRLRNKDIQQVSSLLRVSRLLTLTTFSGVIESIESGYNRLVDWIHFLRHSLPKTVAGCYLDKRI